MRTEAQLREIFIANGMLPAMIDVWIDRLQRMKPSDFDAWLESYFQMIGPHERDRWPPSNDITLRD